MGEILDALRKAEKDPSRQNPQRVSAATARAQAPFDSDEGEATETGVARGIVQGIAGREILLNPSSPSSESYRKLALKIRGDLESRKTNSLVITGPLRSEGKTTTACNLALALASMSGGKRTALVCLDLRRPSIATNFGVTPKVGINEVLADPAQSLNSARIKTDIEGLDLYVPMKAQEDSHTLLGQSRFKDVLRELEQRYDIVILDTPPILLVPDAVIIAEQAGAWTIVVRNGRTRTTSLEDSMRELPSKKFIGAILNEGPLPRKKQDYGYYMYKADEDKESENGS
jgi:capsular exopolysaccharide synthesis family protein